MKVAIIVGHNDEHQGAVNYLDETEFQFNSRIAKKLRYSLLDAHGFEAAIFYRHHKEKYIDEIKDLFKRVGSYIPDISVELHFNAHKSEHARGYKVLVNSNLDSFNLATRFTKAFDDNLMRGSYDKVVELKRVSDRGYWNLRFGKEKNIPASVLVEPAFGTHRTNDSRGVFEKEDLYVMALHMGIVYYRGE